MAFPLLLSCCTQLSMPTTAQYIMRLLLLEPCLLRSCPSNCRDGPGVHPQCYQANGGKQFVCCTIGLAEGSQRAYCNSALGQICHLHVDRHLQRRRVQAGCWHRTSHKSSPESGISNGSHHTEWCALIAISGLVMLKRCGDLECGCRRLAPIRGLAPVKGGKLKNVNSDLMDIFDTIESIPSKPGQLIGEFMSWARGEKDPTWKKRK